MSLYKDIVNEIENKRRFGKSKGVDVSRELLGKMDNPELGQRIIHIAGTNGKGSTAAMIDSVLREAGYKTGLFTSPHLIRFNERIRISGKQISDSDVIRYGGMVLSVPMEQELTMFDCCLAMALQYFKDEQCDYIILETGLGGTYDSTNAIVQPPVLSVITNIGFDHTAILGNTLEEIAANKAGILKSGTKAVIAKMDSSAAEVIQDRCRDLKIPFQTVSDPDQILAQYHVTDIGLLGTYQKENAATAACACGVILGDRNAPAAIQKGIAKAKWPGRMEPVSWMGQNMILDGAHNPQGVQALAESLSQISEEGKFAMIMGVLADKDYGHMLDAILPKCSYLFTVTVDSGRALSNKALAENVRKRGIPAESCDTIEEAVTKAKALAGNLPVICFGSLYFIGNLEGKINGEDTGF